MNSGTLTACTNASIAPSLALGDVSSITDFVKGIQDNTAGANINGCFFRMRDTSGWTGYSSNSWIGGYAIGQNTYGGTYSVSIRGFMSLQNTTTMYSYLIEGTDSYTITKYQDLYVNGGTLTGALTAYTNTNYTTYQVRNIAFTTSTPSSLTNGNICMVYS